MAAPVDAAELIELRRNLTELTIAYKELCQELGHLSRHVAFHEKALKHIAKYGHGSGHGAGHVHGHVHGHGLKEETTSTGHEDHEHAADDGSHEHHHQNHHHHHHHHHHPNRTDTKENEIQVSWPLGRRVKKLSSINFKHFFGQLFNTFHLTLSHFSKRHQNLANQAMMNQ